MTDEPTAEPRRPTRDNDRNAWSAYWNAQGMPWRAEPEIDEATQVYLAERRSIKPDIQLGISPFKDIKPKLTRADIEWLLATHDGGHGPMMWEDENNKLADQRRAGLDLRGADLRELVLSDRN